MKTHISDLFKHISPFRLKGHSIGRKVGDLLEVITGEALLSNPDINRHVAMEALLRGLSDTHRVEFSLFVDPSRRSMESLLAHIECKHVGVEQTINKKYCGDIHQGSSTTLTHHHNHCCIGVSGDTVTVTVNGVLVSQSDRTDKRMIFGTTVTGAPFYVPDDRSLLDVNEHIAWCNIITSTQTETGIHLHVDKCLAGPQTPEKAKQSAFVAVDIQNHLLSQNNRNCVSALIITEASHWELKSRNMATAYHDLVLAIDDELMAEAIEKFHQEFGDDFLTKMTKTMLKKNGRVKEIAKTIVASRDGLIFRDLKDDRLKRFFIGNDGRISVTCDLPELVKAAA